MLLSDATAKITRKLDRTGWDGLTGREQALYLYQATCDAREAGGRLVRIAGAPAVWTPFDQAMHPNATYPDWA